MFHVSLYVGCRLQSVIHSQHRVYKEGGHPSLPSGQGRSWTSLCTTFSVGPQQGHGKLAFLFTVFWTLQWQNSKLRRILRPGIAVHLNFASSSIICVWTYKKLPRNIRYSPDSNTSFGGIWRIIVKAKRTIRVLTISSSKSNNYHPP